MHSHTVGPATAHPNILNCSPLLHSCSVKDLVMMLGRLPRDRTTVMQAFWGCKSQLHWQEMPSSQRGCLRYFDDQRLTFQKLQGERQRAWGGGCRGAGGGRD